MLQLISVTPLLRRWSGRRPYRVTVTKFLEAQCVAADPAGVGTTCAQSTACVYGYAQSAYRRGRNRSSIITKRTSIMKKFEFNNINILK